MMALRQLAPFVIREFGPWRFILIYSLGGVIGFWISYWAGVQLTIGASASICALIGAILYYSKSRGGTYGQALYRQVSGWVLGIFLFGLLVPGINNWAHGGGMAAGILLGLALYAIGALLFFPAAKFEMFYFFLASLYILTFGLAFLETTANPFILSLGDPETATRRLNLSQTFNPLGSLSGMLIAQLYIITLIKSSDYSAESYALLPEAEKAAIRMLTPMMTE